MNARGLRWDPSLALGVATVDLQHEMLFQDVLCFIEDYAQVHFRVEENLMRSSSYPELTDHLWEHEQFTRRLADLKHELQTVPTAEALEALASFVTAWLREHVSGSDQRIGTHLKTRGPTSG